MAEQGHFWFCRVGGRVGCGWEPSWELYALGLATIQTRFYLTVKQFTVHQRRRTAARGWATHLKARCALKPSLCPRPHCDPGKRKRPVSKILLFVFLNCQLRYRFCLYDSHSPRGLGMSRELALELGEGGPTLSSGSLVPSCHSNRYWGTRTGESKGLQQQQFF